MPTPSDVYIGPHTTFKGQTVSFGMCKLKNIANPTDEFDVANKQHVSNEITALSTSTTANIELALTTAKTYTDTNLNTEIVRATLAETELRKNDERQIDVLPVVSVYADGEQPLQLPNAIKANPLFTGVDGWYYKNTIATKKINWYIPDVYLFKLSDIENLTFDATLFSTGSPLFITIYTQKDDVTTNAGSWYKAKITYSVWDTSQLLPYKNYQFTTLKPNNIPLPGKTQYALTLDSVGTVGTYSPNDSILTIAIGTNSAAAANSVEFVLDKVRIHLIHGVITYNFSSFTTEINAVSSSLSSTNTSLTASINTLTNNLSDLTTKQAEDIAAEILRAQAAEVLLSEKCNNLQQSLTAQSAEITQLTSGVNHLYSYWFGTDLTVPPTR